MSLGFKDTISSKIEFLKERAKAFADARLFFQEKNYVEVDVPSILKNPALDAHIDSMEVKAEDHTLAYLHTSPEYLMKRLMSYGFEKIYQISHVYRKGELGRYHNPEFTMVEWYQNEIEFFSMIEEGLDFCQSYLGVFEKKHITYRQLFQTFLKIDPFTCSCVDLKNIAKFHKISCADLNKDGLLQLLFTHVIEPKLLPHIFYIVTDFPESQAALAKVEKKDHHKIAKRFEIYFNKVELANGYHELCDEEELLSRLEKENQLRVQNKKKTYAIDDKFIQAHKYLHDFCGVSVGFDRLLMLKYRKNHLKEVLAFSWDEL